MAIHRQRIDIHSDLTGEVSIDTTQSIEDLVIARKSYGFEWTEPGLRWDREPPYRFAMTECCEFIENTIEGSA